MKPKHFFQTAVQTAVQTAIQTALFTSATALISQQANPFRGVTSATDDIRTIAAAAGAILGGLFALIGGARVGWKMVHREEWTADLIFAICGFVVGVVCVIVM